jgi:hypothetical protein
MFRQVSADRALWRIETHETEPQLPRCCRQHRSGRPRSRDQRHPQLCAKPPHRRPAARRPSASSLPTSAVIRALLARSPAPGWPDALAGGGRSAHPEDRRSTQTSLPRQAERPGRCPEQSPCAAPVRSCFFCERCSSETARAPGSKCHSTGHARCPCVGWQDGGGRRGGARC